MDKGSGGAAAAPRNFVLLLNLLMLCGVLDAIDLMLLSCCSRELQRAVGDAWAGFRAGSPAVLLRSYARPVADAKLNEVKNSDYAPVKEAGPCVLCGVLTRYRHPVESALVCAGCGSDAADESSLLRFRMIAPEEAFQRYGVSRSVDLRLLLRWAERRLPWSDKHSGAVSYDVYAPARGLSVEDVLPTDDGPAPARPPKDVFSNKTAPFVLEHELICLLLERYGGPQLLDERLMNQSLPWLNPASPDE